MLYCVKVNHVLKLLKCCTSSNFSFRTLVNKLRYIKFRASKDDQLWRSNVFDHYLVHYHYLTSFQILFFIFSSRRHQRRRQQYEIFQKILCDTSLNIVKIYFFIISIKNNQKIQFIDNQHSAFTFWFYSLQKAIIQAIILKRTHQKAHLLINIISHWWRRTVDFTFLYLKNRFLDFRRCFFHLRNRKHWNRRILKSTTIKSF